MSEPELLGIGDVAVHIGLTKGTLYVMHSRGELPEPDAYANGGRTKLWKTTTIDTWQKDRRRNKT